MEKTIHANCYEGRAFEVGTMSPAGFVPNGDKRTDFRGFRDYCKEQNSNRNRVTNVKIYFVAPTSVQAMERVRKQKDVLVSELLDVQ